jgi:hypothetical protein
MKKQIMTFDSWRTLQEAQRALTEAEGISRAVFSTLKKFFDEHGKEGSFEDAKSFVSSSIEGWNLSKEDFEEAKKELLKESEILDEATKNLASKLEVGALADTTHSHAKKLIKKATEEQRNKLKKEIEDGMEDNPSYEGLLDIISKVEKDEEEKKEKKEKVDEGKMSEIDAISRESTSKEDFANKLKEYVKSIGKSELANDKEFIETMTSDWELQDEKED